MKRQVFVKKITAKEGMKLKALAERSSLGVVRRRAHIAWCSATGMSAPEIANRFGYDVKHVRLVIHAFNKDGFESLAPNYDGGPELTFDEEVRGKIVDIALGRPKDYGYPFTRWSLRKLSAAARNRKVVGSISQETVRTILKEAGVSHQRTKTWKESKDPFFESKRRRIKRLYKNPPPDGRVMCLDEFGPLSIRPYGGSCYAKKGHPQRIPATYRRAHGVRHMFAVLDLKADQIYYRIRDRKSRVELLDFLKMIRNIVPRREKIYLILDNFSPHIHKSVKKWANENKIVLAYTPTNASWLNRIECHFAPIREFVLKNSDYRSHKELARSMFKYMKWRNRNPRDCQIMSLQRRVKVA
jgi:transposase